MSTPADDDNDDGEEPSDDAESETTDGLNGLSHGYHSISKLQETEITCREKMFYSIFTN